MNFKFKKMTPNPLAEAPPQKHQAWMNGRRFKRNDETFEITEGRAIFQEDLLINVVRFRSLLNDKFYEMEESKFFEKITEFELMSTQINRNN